MCIYMQNADIPVFAWSHFGFNIPVYRKVGGLMVDFSITKNYNVYILNIVYHRILTF